MSNTSNNITGDLFYTFACMKEIHVGIAWNYFAESLCFLLGTPAHCWLLWLSLQPQHKIKPTQVLPLTSMAMDVFYCLHLFLQILNALILQNSTMQHVVLFCFGLSWGYRLLVQICISVEQYMAVLYPVTFLRYKSIHYRILSAVVIWLMSSAYSLFLTFVVDVFPDAIFLSVCVIGVIVISFCCLSLLFTLQRPGPGNNMAKDRGRDQGNQQKRDAFKTISTVLLIVLLSYLPMASSVILYVIKIDMILLICEIVPVMFSFSIYCVMIPPLVKLYKGGHLKCIISKLRQ